MFTIVERYLECYEIEQIIKEIRCTPNITGYSVREWQSFPPILVAENQQQEMMGICFNDDFHPDWTKLDVLLVLERFRGRGIGKKLFCYSVEQTLNKGRKLYTASRNPILIKLMQELDFLIFDDIFHLPEPYRKYQAIFNFHNLKWAMSTYRVKEFVRKQLVYPSQPPFIYGIKAL